MKNLNAIACASLLSVCAYVASAQTPSDAQMMKKREACFAITYDKGSFDHYWEGTTLRTNETIATVSRTTVMPMIAIGILDKLNVYIGVPYVKTESSEPNGGQLQGVKGFQDLTLAAKFQAFSKEIGTGKIDLFAATSYSTPITNYLSDYRPYSLGNGTNEWAVRAIAQYKFGFGLYVRGAGGHIYRGETEIERDFYYNNGPVYSKWMDVPSAWEYSGAVGVWLLNNTLKIEGTYYAMNSTSGDDIRKYNAAQPTNKVNLSQVGGSVQYFIKPLKGISALAYFNKTLDGRNIGKATTFGGGLTFQFNYY